MAFLDAAVIRRGLVLAATSLVLGPGCKYELCDYGPCGGASQGAGGEGAAAGEGASGGGAPDVTPPTIASTSPEADATGVDPATTVDVTFSEAMDATTIDETTFSVVDAAGEPVPGTVTYDDQSLTATFTPDDEFALVAGYDAALGPSIADRAGNALAAEFRWSFAVRDGVWEMPSLIETEAGPASFPDVAVDDAGNAVAVWTQFDGTRTSVWFNRYVPLAGWGTALRIGDNSGNADAAKIAVDADGNAIAVWLQHDGTRLNVWANTYVAGGEWEGPVIIDSSTQNAETPRLAMNADGQAVVVWAHDGGSNGSIWSSRYEPGVGWETPASVEAGSADASVPDVAIDASGTAVVVWVEASNIFANRSVVGDGWGDAGLIELSATTAFDPHVDITPQGEAIVVWAQGGIRSARSTDALGWGVISLVDDGAASASSARVAMDASGNAIVVWEQDGMIWANRQIATDPWGEPVPFGGTGLTPDVDVDLAGNALATWVVNDFDGSTDVWSNRFVVGAGWAGSEELEDSRTPGGVVQQSLSLAPRGTAVAVWTQIPQSITASAFR